MASALKFHHANMSMFCTPLYTPLLYSKTWVYRGIHNFHIFALKHRLWVLVRTASEQKHKLWVLVIIALTEAVLMCTHKLCFEQKYENNQKISTENCHFYSREKIAVCCSGGFS